jgi:hypothetical protein
MHLLQRLRLSARGVTSASGSTARRPAGAHAGRVRQGLAALTLGGLGLAGLGLIQPGLPPLSPSPVQAQGTPSLMEFRWDNTKDYRKLYFFLTETTRLKRSEYYLILRPKDRKTAILKLTITVPQHFDSEIKAKEVKLCRMREGGMLSRTRCESIIPATVEVSPNGKAIEIFPNTPVPVGSTIGVYMTLFNPFNAGMFQFNAMAQATGEVPISGYLGSWLIEVDPN